MVSTIPHSPCTLTNQTCMCTDPVFTGTLELCVQANCTIRESLGKTMSVGSDRPND
jgi:hypothetical protein